MSNKDINDIIDKTHFKSYSHVKRHIKNKVSNVSNNQIKDVIRRRVKDKFINKKTIKKYI